MRRIVAMAVVLLLTALLSAAATAGMILHSAIITHDAQFSYLEVAGHVFVYE